MTASLPFPTTIRRSALALAGAMAAFALASTDAQAAGPRPLFQMPVPCGQTWEASTYPAHWNGNKDPSGRNAIDLAQRDGLGNNISEGEPALASAAGTVLKVYTADNGEHRVFLDHGGGWETHYIHLESVPPLTVGQHIAQGQVVGRISNSGAVSMHLHYNQIADDKAVRVSFNGKLISTHAGNEDSFDTWGTDKAEKLTSLNCPGDTFVPFNQYGLHHQLIYKPASGLVKIMRQKPDGKGASRVWGGYLSRQLTHLVPFTLYGGQQHLFTYQHATGKVEFRRINPGGEGTTYLGGGTWWKGWTHFTPFSLGGRPYFIAYDSVNGYANIDRVNFEGSGSTKIYGSTWTKGWTHLVPFVQGPSQYLLLYRGGTGEAKIVKLSGSDDAVSVTDVWKGTWSAGWSHIVPLKHKGAVHLFTYRASTGKVSYGKIRSGAQGSEQLGTSTWTKEWTAFTPFRQDSHGALFGYKSGDGTAHVRVLNTSGTSSDGIWTDAWTTGWS
jgi:murein DD-endopeptidase MepM/ murein hydrolase activator NlpD